FLFCILSPASCLLVFSLYVLHTLIPVQPPSRDNVAHNLRGPTSDRAQTNVPEEALDRKLLHITITAMKLQTVIRHAVGHFRGKQFSHRHFSAAIPASLEYVGGIVCQLPSRF